MVKIFNYLDRLMQLFILECKAHVHTVDTLSGRYPEPFRNSEQFTFTNCQAGSAFYEFPILRNGTVYRAGLPGAYRVIFTNQGAGNGTFCGEVYHPVSALQCACDQPGAICA